LASQTDAVVPTGTKFGCAVNAAMKRLIRFLSLWIGTSVLAADGPSRAPLEGPPSAWLSGNGQSDEWKTTTGRCRERLQKLDLQQALVPLLLVTLDKPPKMTSSLAELLDSLRRDLTRGIQ
jgi:hypothetical protein